MRDGVVSNSLVAFLRMLTSCEVELKSDFFAPFIMVRCVSPPGTARLVYFTVCTKTCTRMGYASWHCTIIEAAPHSTQTRLGTSCKPVVEKGFVSFDSALWFAGRRGQTCSKLTKCVHLYEQQKRNHV